MSIINQVQALNVAKHFFNQKAVEYENVRVKINEHTASTDATIEVFDGIKWYWVCSLTTNLANQSLVLFDVTASIDDVTIHERDCRYVFANLLVGHAGLRIGKFILDGERVYFTFNNAKRRLSNQLSLVISNKQVKMVESL